MPWFLADHDIAIAAYFIWEKLEKPDGHDIDIWLTAKQYLIDNYKPIWIIGSRAFGRGFGIYLQKNTA